MTMGLAMGAGACLNDAQSPPPRAAAHHEEECIYAPKAEDEADHPCPHDGSSAEQPTPVLAKSGSHHGEPFTLGQATPLAKASGQGELVQVEGVVDAVCQRKGCWMILRDGDRKARILMKDHAFAVPTDSRGKSAVVEGILGEREFSAAQVAHLERDAGREPTTAGARKETILTATGVEIRG